MDYSLILCGKNIIFVFMKRIIILLIFALVTAAAGAQQSQVSLQEKDIFITASPRPFSTAQAALTLPALWSA